MFSKGKTFFRYYLKGPKKGTSDVFIEGLPGWADNIHSNGKGEFYATLVLRTDESDPGLAAVLGPLPYVRKAISTILYLIELPALQLNLYYPNYYSKRLAHWVSVIKLDIIFVINHLTISQQYFSEPFYKRISKSYRKNEMRNGRFAHFLVLH